MNPMDDYKQNIVSPTQSSSSTAVGQPENVYSSGNYSEEGPIRNSSSISVSHLIHGASMDPLSRANSNNSDDYRNAAAGLNLLARESYNHYKQQNQPDLPSLSTPWTMTRQLPHPYKATPIFSPSMGGECTSSNNNNNNNTFNHFQSFHNTSNIHESNNSNQLHLQYQYQRHPLSDQRSSHNHFQLAPKFRSSNGGGSLVSSSSSGGGYTQTAPSLQSSSETSRLDDSSDSSRSNSLEPDTRTFSLTIVQHPVRVRVCGYGEKDRRPIDPPPVAKLRIFDKHGRYITEPNDLHFFVAHASLVAEDGKTDVTVGRDSEGDLRLLMGSLVSSVYTLTDLDGQPGYFFVFPDLSVRIEGSYRLKVTVTNIAWADNAEIGSSCPILASVVTNIFKAFTAKKFPGMLESSDLMKHFAKQGLKLVIRKDSRSNKRGEDDEDDE